MPDPKSPAGPTVNDPAIFDNPLAPEVFADGALGFFIQAGNVHVTFSASRVDHRMSPGPVNRVVVGRVVIPIAGAHALALGLYDFLKKNGIDLTRPEGGGLVQ